jgi:hypothetical protein
MDPTGTVQRLLDLIPLPNNFRVGDGLNFAGHTWSRRVTSDRNQYNTRIDHHVNDRHRFNFDWTHQRTSALNGYAPQAFPQTPGGFYETDVNFFSVRATSIPSTRIVNEFHAGSQPARDRSYASWEREGKALLPVADGIGYRPNFTGGIASVLSRIPLVIHEQNAIPGTTNRWLAKVANKVCEGFPNTFAASPKVVVTGNPVRDEIAAIPAPLKRSNPDQPMHLLIVGGSLGAQAFKLVHSAKGEGPDEPGAAFLRITETCASCHKECRN